MAICYYTATSLYPKLGIHSKTCIYSKNNLHFETITSQWHLVTEIHES